MHGIIKTYMHACMQKRRIESTISRIIYGRYVHFLSTKIMLGDRGFDYVVIMGLGK